MKNSEPGTLNPDAPTFLDPHMSPVGARGLADLPLFAQPVASYRRTDPASSAAAAVATERRGAARSHRERCLAIVRKFPGLTAAEIAVKAHLERHEASRRLPELRRACLIDDGPCRACRVRPGAPMSLTWWPR